MAVKCPTCGESFPEQPMLDQHKANKHPAEEAAKENRDVEPVREHRWWR